MTTKQGLFIKSRFEFGLRLGTQILTWTLVMMSVQSLFRLLAFVLYKSPNHSFLDSEVLNALVLGFRFDLSTVSYALVIPVLIIGPWIALAPIRSFVTLLTFTKLFLVLAAFLISFILMVDLIYYSYFQDHLNILIFGFFEDDTWAITQTLWRNYPAIRILMALGVFTYLLKKLMDRFFLKLPNPTNPQSAPLIFVPHFVLIVIISVLARGGFALFPLGIADTNISKDPFVNHLAFHGVHGLHRAIKLRLRDNSSWNVNAKNYGYSNGRAAAEDYLQKKISDNENDPLEWVSKGLPKNAWAEKQRPHVVVVVMESFGGHWFQTENSEFNLRGNFSKHMGEDYFFKNHFPSMSATIGSLSALMIGTPHRPEGGFLTESRYLQVPFRSSPVRVYKNQGYRTRFIYGGAVGWRDVDKFARAQGFDEIESENDVEKWKLSKNEILEKHDWGAFDQDLFSYLKDSLEKATSPEFVIVMTTTNHPPYQLPASYKKPVLNLPSEIKSRLNISTELADLRFQVFRYANDSLAEFLSQIKNSTLKDRTLLAATGDHNFWIIGFDESELLQKWQVPLYLYLPQQIRPKSVDTGVFSSHADIWATLYPLSLSEVKVPIFGKNLFDSSETHEAYHFSRLAISQKGAVLAHNLNSTSGFIWNKDRLELVPTLDSHPELTDMAKRYRGLMAFLDEFYEYERKLKNANLSR